MSYDNTNTGALFANKDKRKPDANKNWPDSKGTINIDGVEYWLSGWTKKDKNGDKYVSLTAKPKEPRDDWKGDNKRTQERHRSAPEAIRDDGDDIPF